MTASAPLPLLDELQAWRRQMSHEVRLVFDHNDAYERIVAMAKDDQLTESSDAAAEQADYARRLNGLADDLAEMDGRVSEWHGVSREAFDRTMGLLSSRVSALAEVGEQSSQLLGSAHAGRQAADRLFADLVRTSIDYAERSLLVARALTIPTAGASMANWTVANLRQVSKLLDQLADARSKTSALLDQVSYLVQQLADTAAELTGELAGIEQALRR